MRQIERQGGISTSIYVIGVGYSVNQKIKDQTNSNLHLHVCYTYTLFIYHLTIGLYYRPLLDSIAALDCLDWSKV